MTVLLFSQNDNYNFKLFICINITAAKIYFPQIFLFLLSFFIFFICYNQSGVAFDWLSLCSLFHDLSHTLDSYCVQCSVLVPEVTTSSAQQPLIRP